MMAVRLCLAIAGTLLALTASAAQPVILTNHLGYETGGAKRAVIQGQPGDEVRSCTLVDRDGHDHPEPGSLQYIGPVAKWRDWVYWTLDFSAAKREGTFRLTCDTSGGQVRSFPFVIQNDILERQTLSNVLYYFKGQRASGPMDQIDRTLPFEGRGDRTIDAHGGWFDATGDYGKHLSHLSFSTFFNPQQLPLTVWALFEAHDLLQRRADPVFRQYLRRLLDEGAWGADYLVRVKAPNGSFYRSVSAPGPGKRPEDRRIARDASGFAIKQTQGDSSERREAPPIGEREYQSSLRSGAGVAIAALARAAAIGAPGERRGEYLRAAEDAWEFLAKNNDQLTNDGHENIVDDYCALLAATELYRATRTPLYQNVADQRARRLIARLAPAPRAYWRADDGDRPFFHAVDAGMPLVSMISYLDIASAETKKAVLEAVRTSLEWELSVTADVANPFGYARQLVQSKSGARRTQFFYPHDADTAPWWQGEDARLASLAFAARLAIPHFAGDRVFADRLARYALDQLDWILGRNPFDASLLQGTGRNNPEYWFFGSYEYTNAPGGIVNGITAGFKDPDGIDFNLPHTVTGADHDWRWGEQWLPHATWYLLAVTCGDRTAQMERAKRPVIIGYVFSKDQVIDPASIAADKLTHVNYAFADIRDGLVVEGFTHDAENFKILASLRRQHPHLKVLVSVGGWTWSGGFSDAALTPESRRRFVESAVEFVRRHDLDGFDVDWEYPGLPGYGNQNRPEDRETFTSLMTELRAALDKEGAARGRTYLLTFAAGAFPDFIAHTEMAKVADAVDFVNLMTYDFREAEGDALAGHHANLYPHPADDRQRSADGAVRDFLAAGVPAGKLVLGVPFYGRAWGDVKPVGNGLYQPGKPPSERIDTSYGALAADVVGRNGFVRIWDPQSQSPYAWNAEKRIFISYDDPESLRLKCRYVLNRGLAGVMFWEYNADPSGALLDALFKGLSAPDMPEP
jgi:GH18 family chitinase